MRAAIALGVMLVAAMLLAVRLRTDVEMDPLMESAVIRSPWRRTSDGWERSDRWPLPRNSSKRKWPRISLTRCC